jgi:hypothetical protein
MQKMCLGPRCYTPIKLQKLHSILKWNKKELIPKMFLYCPNNIDLVLYYNVSYVISYMLEKFCHFIFIKNTQHYLWTIYYAKNRPPLSHQVQHLSNGGGVEVLQVPSGDGFEAGNSINFLGQSILFHNLLSFTLWNISDGTLKSFWQLINDFSSEKKS